MWLAGNQRERLIQAARTMRSLPDVRNRPVTSLVRSAPLFCEPDTPIREAARLLADAGRSALLVRLRDGLGIVTDVDFRDKVVLSGVSREAPVSSIMTTPVHTIAAEVLAPEASIAMMASGVNHLPVLDAEGAVIGILSASNLMTLDARSPFALRRSLQTAASQDDMARAAADVPHLFVDLLDAHLDAAALMRVLTVLSDAMTARLLELAIARYGRPPVPFAWLAFGSGARSELTMASDQDNGLAYADTDDPAVDEFFRLVAEDVNEGLRRCGFALDPHSVLARYREWRMSLSAWKAVFADCLEGRDLERLARASVAFDFRQVAGELYIDLALTEIMREAPAHKAFMRGLAQLGTRTRLPLGFRQRLEGSFDIKKHGLVPIQNLARYYAFQRGITAHSTVERLIAVRETDGEETVAERSLREAYMSMAHLQLRHHANAMRHGGPLDNIIDVTTLRPLTKVTLQEAMREVAACRAGSRAWRRRCARAGSRAWRRRCARARPSVRCRRPPFAPRPARRSHSSLRARRRRSRPAGSGGTGSANPGFMRCRARLRQPVGAPAPKPSSPQATKAPGLATLTNSSRARPGSLKSLTPPK